MRIEGDETNLSIGDRLAVEMNLTRERTPLWHFGTAVTTIGGDSQCAGQDNQEPHQKSPSASPAPMLLAATQVVRLTLLLTKRRLPSHMAALTPLGMAAASGHVSVRRSGRSQSAAGWIAGVLGVRSGSQ